LFPKGVGGGGNRCPQAAFFVPHCKRIGNKVKTCFFYLFSSLLPPPGPGVWGPRGPTPPRALGKRGWGPPPKWHHRGGGAPGAKKKAGVRGGPNPPPHPGFHWSWGRTHSGKKGGPGRAPPLWGEGGENRAPQGVHTGDGAGGGREGHLGCGGGAAPQFRARAHVFVGWRGHRLLGAGAAPRKCSQQKGGLF